MWEVIELQFSHYTSDKLEEDMLFMNHLYPGNEEKEHIELFKLNEEDLNEPAEEIFNKFGFPVEPFLFDEDILVDTDQIGWFDAGDKAEELIPFGINEINFILREFNGFLEILLDEETLQPVIEDDWVILRFITEEEDDNL